MPLYSQTVRRKSLIQACVVAAIVFGGWAALKAHSAEIEIPPVEAMNLLDRATRDFEADNIDSAEMYLNRFCEALGARDLPDDIQSAVLDMRLKIALRKATRAFHSRTGEADASSDEFAKVWSVVDERTTEFLAYLRRKMAQAEGQKKFSRIVAVSAQEQSLRRERAFALQSMTAYPEALLELKEALTIYTRCLPHAAEKITVSYPTPTGEERKESTRAEQYNLATPEGIAQDRMTVLGLWHTAAPNDAEIKESLTSMRENFLQDFPGHPNAYFIAWEVLEARGTLSADALKTILDSTIDKTTARYASDLISHANRLSMEQRFDEALAEYEAAIALPACPQDRLTELYTQMASTHLYSKRYDKARECVLEAKRHADPAQAIALSLDSKLNLIEEVASNRSLPLSPPSSTNGIQHWLFWLNTLAILVS